jgi:hypothetical protein
MDRSGIRIVLLAVGAEQHDGGFEYTIIQGYERGTWRWSVILKDGLTKAGSIRGKPEALAKVQRTISNAIAPRSVKRQSKAPVN